MDARKAPGHVGSGGLRGVRALQVLLAAECPPLAGVGVVGHLAQRARRVVEVGLGPRSIRRVGVLAPGPIGTSVWSTSQLLRAVMYSRLPE